MAKRSSTTKRQDKKGRNLEKGEYQQIDGRYMYIFRPDSREKGKKKGKPIYIYSWKLLPTDKMPKGKPDDLSLREKEAELLEDKVKKVDSHKKRTVTLNQLFEKHMSLKTLKQSTRTNYLYMYNKYVRPVLGDYLISEITYSDIDSLYQSLLHNGFKPNSIEIVQTILHPVFKRAVKDNIITQNPTDDMISEMKRHNSWEKPKRHALTEEQQTAFINYIKCSDTYRHWLPLFTVALGTGLRVGELIGLTWNDVKNGKISVNHNLIYRQQDNGECEMHITTPKTQKGIREIPIIDKVAQALNEERKKQMRNGLNTTEIDGYRGFIFTNRYGYVHNPQTINRAIKRIYTAYNEQETAQAKKEHREPLLLPHFSMHHLRHTFCTRFCENETNIKAIQEIMGHADISTTMDVYNEASEKKKKEAMFNLQGKIKIG